ncbi:MAG: pyridoxamine 5'-phosphate oxidase family protein [Pseudomonadota bacterium]
MTDRHFVSDIAFTKSVKEEQERLGSRETYERMMAANDWNDKVTPDLAAFLAHQQSFYMASVNADGQPYIQHRGGPKGFIKVIDEKTLGIADFRGNRQYISLGNLGENNKVHLFIMDYLNRSRIKIWAEAEVSEDPELIKTLRIDGYRARTERALIFRIAAWDANCPQHIPQRIDLADAQDFIGKLQARVAELEEENAELRSFVKS